MHYYYVIYQLYEILIVKFILNLKITYKIKNKLANIIKYIGVKFKTKYNTYLI